MKRTVKAREATQELETLLRRVAENGDEVIVEDEDGIVAAIIPANRYAALERNRERLNELLDKAQQTGEHMTEQEVMDLVNDAIREVRGSATRASA